MSHSHPQYGRRTVHRTRTRHRRALLVVALIVAVAVSGPVAGLLAGPARVAGGLTTHARSTPSWPSQGQAAVVLGDGTPAASPAQRPVPIASLAKVMTAAVVLARHPLSGDEDGFSVTASAADVQATARERAEGQSVAAVVAGEPLTERQLLEGLLIPSANNMAGMLATAVAGSPSRFVAEMNARARALGMGETTYTDPSGFDAGTVSTAADQLRILRSAMRSPTFRQIVSMADVTLPFAGTLKNFNPLTAEGYFGKTGSDSAAGGCLAFFTSVVVGAHRQTVSGVVLGQGQGDDTADLLAAAGHAAQDLVGSVAPPLPLA